MEPKVAMGRETQSGSQLHYHRYTRTNISARGKSPLFSLTCINGHHLRHALKVKYTLETPSNVYTNTLASVQTGHTEAQHHPAPALAAHPASMQ